MLLLVRLQVQVQELVLLREQEQERELVQELVQQVQQVQWRRRNQGLQLLGSSWHRASIGRSRFSKLRQPHCASCEFLARQPLKQRLRQPGMRRFCLV